MTAAELLTKVKNGLGITGDFQDATLQVYADEVKAFMKSAGVPKAVIDSNAAVGCIMRGVADLWNYGSGEASLSEYFKQRMLQLKATAKDKIIETIIADYTESIDVDHLTNTVTFHVPDDLPKEYVIEIFVNGILENEGEQYSISGDTITFGGNIIAGTNVVVKIYYTREHERGAEA